MPHLIDILLRVLAAVVAGAVLGVPSRKQPGGLRTHVLVAAGATLFVIVATRDIGTEGQGRALQGVATGVGFIGAAAVMKLGGRVRGVNAAASIWVTGNRPGEDGFR